MTFRFEFSRWILLPVSCNNMSEPGTLFDVGSGVEHSEEGDVMRVYVDFDLCKGHGQCEDAAPEVFRVEDDGFAHVLVEHPSDELRPKVDEAVLRCPENAVFVYDE